MMKKIISSRRAVLGLAVATCASAVAIAVTSIDSHSASAATYSALSESQSAGSAADDPALKALQDRYPQLKLADARKVLSDEHGVVWLTPATDGDVCVVERVGTSDTSASRVGLTVSSRFSCASSSDAADRGVIGGVPGDFYGVVPDGVTRVVAAVNGARVSLAVRNNAFRVPADATSVAVGSAAPAALPAQLPDA